MTNNSDSSHSSKQKLMILGLIVFLALIVGLLAWNLIRTQNLPSSNSSLISSTELVASSSLANSTLSSSSISERAIRQPTPPVASNPTPASLLASISNSAQPASNLDSSETISANNQ